MIFKGKYSYNIAIGKKHLNGKSYSKVKCKTQKPVQKRLANLAIKR